MARREMSEMQVAEAAVQMGGSDALYNLGMMCANGRDSDPDMVSAHKWFNLAAIRGNKAALAYRIEIAREMSTHDIAEAQRQAREWLTTH